MFMLFPQRPLGAELAKCHGPMEHIGFNQGTNNDNCEYQHFQLIQSDRGFPIMLITAVQNRQPATSSNDNDNTSQQLPLSGLAVFSVYFVIIILCSQSFSVRR